MLTSDINATIRNGNISEEIIMFSRFKPLLLVSRQNRFWFFFSPQERCRSSYSWVTRLGDSRSTIFILLNWACALIQLSEAWPSVTQALPTVGPVWFPSVLYWGRHCWKKPGSAGTSKVAQVSFWNHFYLIYSIMNSEVSPLVLRK